MPFILFNVRNFSVVQPPFYPNPCAGITKCFRPSTVSCREEMFFSAKEPQFGVNSVPPNNCRGQSSSGTIVRPRVYFHSLQDGHVPAPSFYCPLPQRGHFALFFFPYPLEDSGSGRGRAPFFRRADWFSKKLALPSPAGPVHPGGFFSDRIPSLPHRFLCRTFSPPLFNGRTLEDFFEEAFSPAEQKTNLRPFFGSCVTPFG